MDREFSVMWFSVDKEFALFKIHDVIPAIDCDILLDTYCFVEFPVESIRFKNTFFKQSFFGILFLNNSFHI